MAAKVTQANVWAGAQLRHYRNAVGLTQDELAEATGIDRATIIKLEKGQRTISPTYADRIAPHVKVRNSKRLMPQPEPKTPQTKGPLDRLAELEASVAAERQQAADFAQAVTARLAALEAALLQQAQRSAQQSSEQPG